MYVPQFDVQFCFVVYVALSGYLLDGSIVYSVALAACLVCCAA